MGNGGRGGAGVRGAAVGADALGIGVIQGRTGGCLTYGAGPGGCAGGIHPDVAQGLSHRLSALALSGEGTGGVRPNVAMPRRAGVGGAIGLLGIVRLAVIAWVAALMGIIAMVGQIGVTSTHQKREDGKEDQKNAENSFRHMSLRPFGRMCLAGRKQPNRTVLAGI